MRRTRSMRFAMVTTGLVTLAATAAMATSPEVKCEADKNKVAGKYAFCRQKAEAKAVKTGAAADYAKCNEQLSNKWSNAESKAASKGAACVDSVDATEIENYVAAHADNVAAALSGSESLASGCALPATGQVTTYGAGSDGDTQIGAPLAFIDNGDGTVSDVNTGLMWEKKGMTAVASTGRALCSPGRRGQTTSMERS